MSPTVRKARARTLAESILLRADVYTPRPDWRQRRGCHGLPVALFYSDFKTAAKVCADCPVRIDCCADLIATEDAEVRINDIAGYRAVSAQMRRDRRDGMGRRETMVAA